MALWPVSHVVVPSPVSVPGPCCSGAGGGKCRHHAHLSEKLAKTPHPAPCNARSCACAAERFPPGDVVPPAARVHRDGGCRRDRTRCARAQHVHAESSVCCFRQHIFSPAVGQNRPKGWDHRPSCCGVRLHRIPTTTAHRWHCSRLDTRAPPSLSAWKHDGCPGCQALPGEGCCSCKTGAALTGATGPRAQLSQEPARTLPSLLLPCQVLIREDADWRKAAPGSHRRPQTPGSPAPKRLRSSKRLTIGYQKGYERKRTPETNTAADAEEPHDDRLSGKL